MDYLMMSGVQPMGRIGHYQHHRRRFHFEPERLLLNL